MNAKRKAAVRSRVSAICRALPEVSERAGQHSKFTVRGRTVAYYLDDHHGDGIVAVCVKAPPGAQHDLRSADPERYLIPDYLGPRGWVELRLDRGRIDWDEVT
jgi:phosphoribosylglycinamide formyltransferase-1